MRALPGRIGRGMLAATLLAAGCAHHETIQLPPLVELREYPVIGLVEFECDASASVGRMTSAQFVEALQYWQPGVRVLELGPEAALLDAVGRDALGFEAVRAIGERYGVAAVFVGAVELGAVTPQLSVARFLQSASVGTEIQASLVARLLETGTGATAWTGSSSAGAQLAHASLGPSHASFDPGNRDAATASLVRDLIDRVTYDFRPRYERR